MSKPNKGGRPAWPERPGDPRVVYTVNLYESQRAKLLELGGAEYLRAHLDAVIDGERRRATRRKK